jgi:PAS domain S-box-containing protein
MSNERILIVDDEHDFVTFLAKCLQRMGYVISGVATTGEGAVTEAGRSRPDLVLMDISMPGEMGGIGAAIEIHTRWDIPVIFLTGSDDEKTIQRAKLSEPLGYLLKPFKPRELKSTIDTVLYTFKASRARRSRLDQFTVEQYRSLFENAVEGIFQATPAGFLITANSSAARILGFDSSGEMMSLGLDLQDLLGIPGTVNAELMRRLAGEGKVEEFELHALRRDGCRVSLAMNLRAVRDNAGAIVRLEGSMIDITARKRAFDQLHASEHLNRMFLNKLPQRIFYKDHDLVFLAVNELFAADLGLKPEDIIGKTDYDFFPLEMADKFRADDRSVMQSGKTITLVEKNVAHGKERNVEVTKLPLIGDNGEAIGILGVFSDLTEQKPGQKEPGGADDQASGLASEPDCSISLMAFRNTAF